METNKRIRTVGILGTIYTIEDTTEKIIIDGFEVDGVVDYSEKEIKIYKHPHDHLYDITLRHEIIHATLYESGLADSSEWATNEEMVDWFAIQWEKLEMIIEDALLI